LNLGQTGAAIDSVRAMRVPQPVRRDGSLMPAAFAASFIILLTARSVSRRHYFGEHRIIGAAVTA
jgi:hypothetical protein